MEIEEWLRKYLEVPARALTVNSVPADYISRQAWQEAVERLVKFIRDKFDRPAFGLSESEISVHYHLPLKQFISLIEKRLGMKS